jgi:hypothetical protein
MAGSASRKQRAGVRLDRSDHPDFFNVRPAAPDRPGAVIASHQGVYARLRRAMAKQSSAQCKPPLDCFRLRAPRFGGLQPTEARQASVGGSSLTLLAMTTHIRHYRAGEPTPETSVTIWLTLTIRDEALTPEWARPRGCDGKGNSAVIAGLDPAIHAAAQHGPPGHRRAKRRRSLNGYARW